MDSETYKLSVVYYMKKNNHIEYLLRVTESKSNKAYDFFERYSNLEKLHQILRKEANSDTFPKFPPKKFFGDKNEKFLKQRQEELNLYFNMVTSLFNLPSLKVFIENGKKNCWKIHTNIDNDLNEKILCKICLSKEVNYVLIPCGHTLCEECCKSVSKCPFDRKDVQSKNQFFLV